MLDCPFRILKCNLATALSVRHHGSCGVVPLALVPFWDYALAVRVIAVATLRAFWQKHPDAEQPLKAWFEEATKASWSQPSDIKAQYRSASVLKNRRVVFNIKGNEYRLIVAIAYRLQVVYVKFIGTHTEYNAVDADNVEPD